MVFLYNDKTAVDVPDCKMMKIWLSQNFLIGTAPRSLDKRHGQVRKCWRNLTSIPAPLIWRHTTPSAVKKWVRCTRGSTPCFKTEHCKTENRKNRKSLETGVTLPTKVYRRWYLSENRDSACNELCAWQDGNEYSRIKWARLFSPLKRNRRVPADMIVSFRNIPHKSREVKLSATSSISTGLP